MKIYYDEDASFDILQGKKVGVIGFGSQGHAQAQNLRDSGVSVMVSEVPNTPNYELGFEIRFYPGECRRFGQAVSGHSNLDPGSCPGAVV